MTEWIALTDIATRPRPGRVVACDAGVDYDHAAWRGEVARWRCAFAARPGRRWAMHFEHTVRFSAALYGAWHAGKQVILCADLLPETLARLQQDVDGVAGDFPAELQPLSPDVAARDEQAWAPLDEAAIGLILHTSGSSGEAEPVPKRLGQLAHEILALQAQFGECVAGTMVQGTVSHQHIYGLLFRVLWPLAAGLAIAPRRFFHEEIAAAIGSPAILVTSPAHLKRIPAALDWTAARAHLRAVFSSGGALPQAAAIQAHRCLGQAVIELYGSTETGGIAWRRRAVAEPPWKALAHVAWRVVEEHLEVTSPHLAERGWWRCADRVAADADGGFRLLGRVDRIVKVEERRVSLSLVEQLLLSQPEVAEARVLLLQGRRATLAAVIVLSARGQARRHAEGGRKLGVALARAIAGASDALLRPRRWRFVSALPMNTQGKVTEAALRTLFRPLRPVPHWQLREPDTACVELTLDAELAVFDGHFPQCAILPGVAQVDWAVHFAREVFALDGCSFQRLEALKFQRVVRPGARIILQLGWSAEKSALSFSYHSEHGSHASGRVIFAEGVA